MNILIIIKKIKIKIFIQICFKLKFLAKAQPMKMRNLISGIILLLQVKRRKIKCLSLTLPKSRKGPTRDSKHGLSIYSILLKINITTKIRSRKEK